LNQAPVFSKRARGGGGGERQTWEGPDLRPVQQLLDFSKHKAFDFLKFSVKFGVFWEERMNFRRAATEWKLRATSERIHAGK